MKNKLIYISIFVLIFMFVPNKIFATNNQNEYEIVSYDIDMKVNENNTFDIKETIDVYFFTSNKHGIYRKIPFRNKVKRLDGSESSNFAYITNINASDEFKTYSDNEYQIIKIGSANKTVNSREQYIIEYTYNIGKDPLKNEDELYFNLIGTQWDANIRNVNFIIRMPKEFDQTKLGFTTGYNYSMDTSNITYTVSENTINGSVNKTLQPGEGLTVRLSLPEGYFVGASNNIDFIKILRIAIYIISVFVAFYIWYKYGRDEMAIDTVEFYPPEGLNSADVGYIYKGYSDKKDIVSLVIYLANKGYLRIEEYENVPGSRSFKIIKIKEYDGNNSDERDFLNKLFNTTDFYESKNEVTRDELYDNFYVSLEEITKNKNKTKNLKKIFNMHSLTKRGIIIILIIMNFTIMYGISIITNTSLTIIALVIFYLVSVLLQIYNKPNLLSFLLNLLYFTFLGVIFMKELGVEITKSLLIEFSVYNFCILLLLFFLIIVKKRTKYGTEMLGKIKGFKRFLETAEKSRLEELVMEDPEYFYNILPYTYVLGVSSKWISKFEDIAVKDSSWFSKMRYRSSSDSSSDSTSNSNKNSINEFVESTYPAITDTMTVKVSKYRGTGGGFAGGGSGGGGGGIW